MGHITTNIESRRLSMQAARYRFATLGMSYVAFETIVMCDIEAFTNPKVQEALTSLQERDELEHLMQCVWFPFRPVDNSRL